MAAIWRTLALVVVPLSCDPLVPQWSIARAVVTERRGSITSAGHGTGLCRRDAYMF